MCYFMDPTFQPSQHPPRSKSFVKGATKDVAGQRKSHLNAGIYQLCAVAATEARLEGKLGQQGSEYLRKLYFLQLKDEEHFEIPFPKTQQFWGDLSLRSDPMNLKPRSYETSHLATSWT